MKKKAILINIVLAVVLSPVSGQVLNVSKITQTQSEWCWAGVSACVLEFYGKPVSQCQIAEYTRTVEQFNDISFGNANCCSTPASCNNWNYNYGGAGSIEDILVHFAGIINQNFARTITLPEVTTSINANRPFIIRWGWTSGGGHFVVGHGVSGENVYYMNPWPGEGKKIATYSWIAKSSDHTWTHTNTFTVSAQLPGNAGRITGDTVVCQGQKSVTYSIPAVERALTYVWTLPDGTAGRSTVDSITVNYGKAAVSGAIAVTAMNNLGGGRTSMLPVRVNPLPAPAGEISGNTQVCHRQKGVTYSVPEIVNASSYTWTVNTDAEYIIKNNTITLNFGINSGEGTLSVAGKNDCGEGVTSTIKIKLSGIPETPVIKQTGNTLTSSSPVGNQWYNSAGPIDGATLPEYNITATDEYYVIVTIDGCSSDPSDSLPVILNGVNNQNSSSGLNVYPNPAADKLVIETGSNTNPVLLKILNLIGQPVYQSQLTNNAIIDIGHFSPGIYLVKMEMGNGVFIRKFIKE